MSLRYVNNFVVFCYSLNKGQHETTKLQCVYLGACSRVQILRNSSFNAQNRTIKSGGWVNV